MVWYEIPGFPGYRINHHREVLSLKQDEPRVMKTWIEGDYHRVMLRRNGEYVNCKIAYLMLITFVGPRPEGQEICHGSEGSLNDSLTNIRWGTSSENNFDQVEHGTHYEAARDCCDQGHEFTPENTGWRWGKGGKKSGVKCRRCKECHRINTARCRAKKKAQNDQ
jgi:hypothetical protein